MTTEILHVRDGDDAPEVLRGETLIAAESTR